MDKSEVARVVNAAIKPLRAALYLQAWEIDIKYHHIEPNRPMPEGYGVRGDCFCDPKYQHAVIRLDPEMFSSESMVLDTLRHELLHIFHHHHATLRDAYEKLLPDPQQQAALNGLLALVAESSVRCIENMLDIGLNSPVRSMIRRGEKNLASHPSKRRRRKR
jgi:hypothetical protein